MICAKLMSHFVRHIINIKRIIDWRSRTRNTSRFIPCTNNTQTCQTATIRTEDVTDIVVCGSNYRIGIGYILGNHRIWTSIGKRIFFCVSINDEIIIRDHYHGHRNCFFVNSIHASHRHRHCSQSFCYRSTMENSVFCSSR